MANRTDFPLEVVDSSCLTDADWAKINQIKKAYETGGTKGLTVNDQDVVDLLMGEPQH